MASTQPQPCSRRTATQSVCQDATSGAGLSVLGWPPATCLGPPYPGPARSARRCPALVNISRLCCAGGGQYWLLVHDGTNRDFSTIIAELDTTNGIMLIIIYYSDDN